MLVVWRSGRLHHMLDFVFSIAENPISLIIVMCLSGAITLSRESNHRTRYYKAAFIVLITYILSYLLIYLVDDDFRMAMFFVASPVAALDLLLGRKGAVKVRHE